MQLVLIRDARDGLGGREVADVLGRERRGLLAVLFDNRALQGTHHDRLLPLEFRRGEPGGRDARRLGEERVETRLDAALPDSGGERPGIRRAHERTNARPGAEERRARLQRNLTEPRVQHSREQALEDDLLPVRRDRRLIACRHRVVHADARAGQFGIGRNGIGRAGMVRHRECRPRPRRFSRGNRREVFLDQRLDGLDVEVPDGDHRHQVRAIPVCVELSEPGVRELLQDLRCADRQPVCIA